MRKGTVEFNVGYIRTFSLGSIVTIGTGSETIKARVTTVRSDGKVKAKIIKEEGMVSQPPSIVKKIFVENFSEAKEVFTEYGGTDLIRIMGVNVHIARELHSIQDAETFYSSKKGTLKNIPSNELDEIREDMVNELSRRDLNTHMGMLSDKVKEISGNREDYTYELTALDKQNKPLHPHCRSIADPAAMKLLRDMERDLFSDGSSEEVSANSTLTADKLKEAYNAVKKSTFPDIDLDKSTGHGGVFRESPISWMKPIMPTLPPGAKLFMPNMSRFEITGTPKMKDECDCGFVEKVSAAHYDWCSKKESQS